jgi:hypothetical protein
MNTQDGVFHSAYPAFTNWACTGWNNTAMTLPSIAFDDPQTAWCWGRMNLARGKTNTLHMFQWYYDTNKAYEDHTKTSEHEASFHLHYITHVLEYAARLGVADAQTFVPAMRQFWVDLISGLQFASNPDTYPMTDSSGNPWTTWSAPGGGLGGFLAAYYTPSPMTDWCDDTGTLGAPRACGPDYVYATHHSYVHLALASAALAESTPLTAQGNTGAAVWAWMKANVPFQQNYGTAGLFNQYIDPRYAWEPQYIRGLTITPASTSAALSFTSYSTDTARVAVSATPFASSDSTLDATATMSGVNGSYTATSLNPSTTYYYRVTAGRSGGTVRATGTFVTTGSSSQPSTTVGGRVIIGGKVSQ